MNLNDLVEVFTKTGDIRLVDDILKICKKISYGFFKKSDDFTKQSVESISLDFLMSIVLESPPRNSYRHVLKLTKDRVKFLNNRTKNDFIKNAHVDNLDHYDAFFRYVENLPIDIKCQFMYMVLNPQVFGKQNFFIHKKKYFLVNSIYAKYMLEVGQKKNLGVKLTTHKELTKFILNLYSYNPILFVMFAVIDDVQKFVKLITLLSGESLTFPKLEDLFNENDDNDLNEKMINNIFNFKNIKTSIEFEDPISFIKEYLSNLFVKYEEVQKNIINKSDDKTLLEIYKSTSEDDQLVMINKLFDEIKNTN